MADEPTDREPFSLRRWSQRKRDAARRRSPDERTPQRDRITALPASDATQQAGPSDHAAAFDSPPATMPNAAAPLAASAEPVAAGSSPAAQPSAPETPALPPLDTLTIDSDYSVFMRPGVDDSVKCGALKKLFSDPRFNAMDGLDVYIDDYSKPDPIDPEVVRTLVSARYIFNPPATRVNALGHVEDVPDVPPPQVAQEAAPEPQAAQHVAPEHGKAAQEAAPEPKAAQDAAPEPQPAQHAAPEQQQAAQDAAPKHAAPQQEALEHHVPPADSQPISATDVTDASAATSNRR